MNPISPVARIETAILILAALAMILGAAWALR